MSSAPRATRCDRCGKPLGSTCVFKGGEWLCPSCLYREEVGEPQPGPKRERPAPAERFFPV